MQKLRKSITSTEFLLWIEFLEKKKLEREKLDYYLAQIAFEVHRCASKEPKSVKFDQFLMSFEMKEDRVHKIEDPLEAEEAAALRLELSKAAWKAIPGVVYTPPPS